MSKLDGLYGKMPVAIQHIAVSSYGIYWHWLRFGGKYASYESDYTKRTRFDAQEWKAYQQSQLIKLGEVAVSHVSYYRQTWTDIQKEAVLRGEVEALPLLEKEPLRKEPLSFLRDEVHPFPRLIFHTSGSTGTPIATYWTASELRDSLAVREIRSARWAGVSFKLPRATFSGRMVEPDPESTGPYYRYNAVEKQVYFSAFHLRQETAASYVAALAKHNIQWMTGYAVSFYLLARFILQEGLKVPPLKAIITTSEKLTPEMRQVMERAYGCRVFEEYSTVENALFASECEHGRLHVSPDVSIVEILRPDGSKCEPGEVGEVVTTCLMRTYQPLIRYRLGDLAAWDPDPCPCGRSMPVIKEVVGRLEDVVVGPDGRQMVRFHGIFVDQPHIREGQIIQEALDRIRVKVVTIEGFSVLDIQDITHRMKQRLGDQVNVIVEPVSEIPRTKAGKFKAVISLLN